MKKEDVLNLIKYHVEKNEKAFRDEAILIARYFDEIGDSQLAEYILGLLSEKNVFVPQIIDNYDIEFLKLIETKNMDTLDLPIKIAEDIRGIINAINHNVGINKFLFEGSPGTGKTEAAKNIARLLNRSLFKVDIESLIDSKLGQTNKNIIDVFKGINLLPNPKNIVILFDEIDVIALDRINSNDVREMGRATSTILRELDRLAEINKEIVIIATTNLYSNFDKALIRRFDAVIHFDNYSKEDLTEVAEHYFSSFAKAFKLIAKDMPLFKKILKIAKNLPYPGELKNIIKSSIAFSNESIEYEYLKRLYNNLIGGLDSKSIEQLRAEGFTIREIEKLKDESKSSVSRNLRRMDESKGKYNILELRGNPFIQAPKSVYGGGIYINSHVVVTVEYLENLKSQLSKIKEFWKKEPKFFNGILISVYYNKIVAKSNRIVALFKKENSDNLIVGVKFNKQKTKHIITYFIKEKTLADSIEFISNISKILSKHFDGQINSESFKNQEILKKIIWEEYQISKTTFQQLIADISYIEAFNIDTYQKEESNTIVTLYNVNEGIDIVLKKIGINILKTNIFDNQTVLLDDKQLELLIEKAPYLISMAVEDLSSLSPDTFKTCNNSYPIMTIPDPISEPIIGVIDTAFDTNVYFNKWVEYEDMVDPNIPKNPNDCVHGTAVSSIIVDGPKLNPWLDDGCGRFRVKHFGVSRDKKFSSFTLIKEIKKIVLQNSKIKVWNLSLGSNSEIDDNFISFAGAALDKIQFENDVIFVIAGTNDENTTKKKKIGSPADSINSIVVNLVTENGLPANYSRSGLALSFFSKPDVSYYGGSKEKMIRVCTPQGEEWRMGTSFAAPWIARKLAYLIHILGFNREVAKALIIDTARGWTTPEDPAFLGHGIVPKHINDIIQSKTDEIKFIVSDISEKWNTYNYNFPIPLIENKYPYIAKATMCYFPLCNRLQGVDYTNTELNLHFGRINDSNTIVDIKNDYQNQEDKPGLKKYYIFEDEARKGFRKWDNVKCVVENNSKRSKPKKSYKYKDWGMEIKTNNRINSTDGIGIRFGVVVTIKEINGVNRINEFIKNCVLSGWLVNKIKVENKIEIHQKASENIEFE